MGGTDEQLAGRVDDDLGVGDARQDLQEVLAEAELLVGGERAGDEQLAAGAVGQLAQGLRADAVGGAEADGEGLRRDASVGPSATFGVWFSLPSVSTTIASSS